MVRNCAVIIGINDYDEIQPLKYAKSDAEKMRDFFLQDLGVSEDYLYFFTDDSPRNAKGRKTQPTYGTLRSFLTDRFEKPFLSAGDTLWFYFSGHGMPWDGHDYLLPSDGNPRSMPELAIPIGYLTGRLRRSGADNVVLLIDACRSDGAKNAGVGIGQEEQQGVITFFSCSPTQVSYEIDELQQGAFTKVLLEALRIQGEGNCATVERFSNYLKNYVPRLTQQYKNYSQVPYAIIEPETKLHYILLPKFANLTDIALLKLDAALAEAQGNFRLAFELWMRVNVSSGGTDWQAIEAFQRIGNRRSDPQPISLISSDTGNKALSTISINSLRFEQNLKEQVELVSSKSIDYRELEQLLKVKEWQKADALTDKLMLGVAKCKESGYMRGEDIKQFPCKDLQTIDRLWLQYSDGLYGFSVQKQIYVECGGKLDFSCPSKETWEKFCDRTAWKKSSKWVSYLSNFFEEEMLNRKGHLPFLASCGGRLERVSIMMGLWESFYYFFSHIAICEM